jgi:beta-glucanase (GH16 family)
MSSKQWARLLTLGAVLTGQIACTGDIHLADGKNGLKNPSDTDPSVGGAHGSPDASAPTGDGDGDGDDGTNVERDAGTPSAGHDAGQTSDEPPAIPGWNLVWNDEFTGTAGGRFDDSKWSYSNGPNNANNELEYYTDRPENSGLDGQGHMLIISRLEDMNGYRYTSAKVTTAGKFEPKYGRIETRVKLPRGQGMWPAFWALGTDIGDPNVGWPQCGEIDIMETVGSDLQRNHGSLHGPGYSGGNPLTATVDTDDLSQDFHSYAVEWEENVIRFYVDDNLYETRTPDDVPGGSEWVYDHSIFLIMNVAVGGTFPGDPDDSIFPQTMTIDYVRVYSR